MSDWSWTMKAQGKFYLKEGQIITCDDPVTGATVRGRVVENKGHTITLQPPIRDRIRRWVEYREQDLRMALKVELPCKMADMLRALANRLDGGPL